MSKIKKSKKSKKGFTLIELLIVVAIIAILAAIAIPQFAAYRIRGYNAAANSDLRNAKTAEEALFADFQSYGITLGGAVVLVTPFTLTTEDSSSNTRTLDSGLSNNVSALATGSQNLAGYTNRWQNYTAFAKHVAGDRIFGADDNMTSLYWKLGPVALALATTDAVTSTSNPDLTGAGGFTAL